MRISGATLDAGNAAVVLDKQAPSAASSSASERRAAIVELMRFRQHVAESRAERALST